MRREFAGICRQRCRRKAVSGIREVIMKKYVRRMLAVTLSAVMAMGFAGCGGSGSEAGAGAAKAEEKSIVVGSKDFTENEIVSPVLGVVGCSCLWSILELFEQKKRLEKGWFPMNPKRKDCYRKTGSSPNEKNE
jgi:hypothetical protein